MKIKGSDKRMERKTMVWLIVIIAVAVVAMFSGCVEDEANEEASADEETAAYEE